MLASHSAPPTSCSAASPSASPMTLLSRAEGTVTAPTGAASGEKYNHHVALAMNSTLAPVKTMAWSQTGSTYLHLAKRSSKRKPVLTVRTGFRMHHLLSLLTFGKIPSTPDSR